MKVTRIVHERDYSGTPISKACGVDVPPTIERTEVVSVNAALIELVYPWHPSAIVRDGGPGGSIIRLASGREISVTETIEQIGHRRTIELGRPVE